MSFIKLAYKFIGPQFYINLDGHSVLIYRGVLTQLLIKKINKKKEQLSGALLVPLNICEIK